MALSDYKPETIKVKGRNYQFDVRGLSMQDVAALMRTHMDDLENLFKLYEQQGSEELTAVSLGRFALALVKDAPGLTAHIVALASDEPEAVDNAARLPFMAQVEALKGVGTLTFAGVGGVKKFMTNLDDLLSGVAPASKQQKKTLKRSSAGSART